MNLQSTQTKIWAGIISLANLAGPALGQKQNSNFPVDQGPNIVKLANSISDTIKHYQGRSHIGQVIVYGLQVDRYQKIFPNGQEIPAWIEIDPNGYVQRIAPFHIEAVAPPGWRVEKTTLIGSNTLPTRPIETAIIPVPSNFEKTKKWIETWERGSFNYTPEQVDLIFKVVQECGASIPVRGSDGKIQFVTVPEEKIDIVELFLKDDPRRLDYEIGLGCLSRLMSRLAGRLTREDCLAAIADYVVERDTYRKEMRMALIEEKSAELNLLREMQSTQNPMEMLVISKGTWRTDAHVSGTNLPAPQGVNPEIVAYRRAEVGYREQCDLIHRRYSGDLASYYRAKALYDQRQAEIVSTENALTSRRQYEEDTKKKFAAQIAFEAEEKQMRREARQREEEKKKKEAEQKELKIDHPPVEIPDLPWKNDRY